MRLAVHLLLCFFLAACSTVSRAPSSPASAADLILTGGKVFTADSVQPWAEAVAIRGERIIAVGANTDVERFAGPSTQRIALDGRAVIPGINDAHNHLAWVPPVGNSFVIHGNPIVGPSRDQLLDSLSARAAKTPPGGLIHGHWGLQLRNDPTFRRAALDSVAPNHPVILTAVWGHGVLLNTQALRVLGISETEPDPLGGWYERVPGTQTLTGLADEYAQFRPWHVYQLSAADEMVQSLRTYTSNALRLGITSVQHMSSTPDASTTARMFREADLPLRVRVIPFPATDAKGRRLAEWKDIAPQLAPRTKVSGIKYLIDATPLEQLALMRTPYPGRPGWYGRLNLPEDTIRQILREALTSDQQLMLHIAGDSATAIVLSLMEAVAPDTVWQARRVRIEHGPGITGSDVARARRLGIVITQPREGAPLRTWQEAGIRVGYGSDTSPNPFVDLVVATISPGNPSEAISREDAVRMYTQGSAYAEFAEREKGALAPGMLADLVVLSQDIFTVPAEALPTTTSVLTLIGGKAAYDAGLLKPTPRTR